MIECVVVHKEPLIQPIRFKDDQLCDYFASLLKPYPQKRVGHMAFVCKLSAC